METGAVHPPRPSFGALVKRHREGARLTQEELAERAAVSVRGLRYLEQDQRRPYRETVQRLAEALALTPEDRAALHASADQATPWQGLPAPRTEQASTAVPRQIGASTVLDPDGPHPALPHPITPLAHHNLPAQLTRFIGREQELVEVQQLLAETRLLTLTGTGGVGKTRLALQVAAAALDRYPQGVWLVELAPLADPTLVPGAALAALRVQEQPDRPALETLLEALRMRQLLLVLDNCEHLRDACAHLSAALLRGCPQLQIVATSRQPLGLGGEQCWRAPSLSVPAPEQFASLTSVARCEAVQLFLERARAVQPQFALTSSNVQSVAGVCARLDGIPLALELAAARLGALGLAELATHLDQRFRLLTGGSRTALPRQQTLQATVEWSYSLLTPQEQLLFARLSVFTGGFTLEGAEAVGAGGTITTDEVLDLLARLVDKSLVIADETGAGSTHYRLLEMLRQYGWERLLAGRETASALRRHANYYLALAERAEQGLIGPDQLRWLDGLEREHDNLRAALAWSLGGGEHRDKDVAAQAVETGMRLAGALFWFWFYRDHHQEALMWLERALAPGAVAPAAVRAKALYGAGVFTLHVNDDARSRMLLSESVALTREAGDSGQCVLALCGLGFTMCHCGQDEQAVALLEESVALARAVGEPWPLAIALLHWLLRILSGEVIERAEERARAWAAGAESLHLFQAVGDPMGVAMVQMFLGQIALYEGDYERARVAFIACLPMIRALGWRSSVADGLVRLANVARAQGDYAEATALYAEALTLYRQVGDHLSPVIASVLSRLAAIAVEQGEWTVAQTQVAESLVIARDIGQVGTSEGTGALEAQAALATGRIGTPELAVALDVVAALAAVQGAPGRAVRLAGAAASLRAHSNRPPAASEQATLERILAPGGRPLSADEQATAWVEGQAMTREQAIAYALDAPPSTHRTPRAKSSCS